MSIVLDLTPAEEETLLREAGERQVDIVTYIRGKVFPKAPRSSPEGNRDPSGQVYRIDRALSVLDELDKSKYRVTDDDWNALTQGIEDARPGQRSVFGTGVNPPAEETAR